MADLIPSISIVIPVGPSDQSWIPLLDCLRSLPAEVEVCFVGTAPQDNSFADLIDKLLPTHHVFWINSPPGRAKQMNMGASRTSGEWLWFLHADSLLTASTLQAVIDWCKQGKSSDLGFLDLRFAKDGPKWMWVNSAGVWFRSHYLKIPFGDQGLCLSRELFFKLGRFEERAAYGEDHLLVWKVRKAGGRIVGMGATIVTSSRKYRERGWLKTTLTHLYLTARQAFPNAVKRRQS